MSGNLGRGVMKTSAVPAEYQVIEGPALVFDSQHQVQPAFDAGLLNQDCVVVVRYQGPKAVGMPELHKLMPPLGVLLDRGFKVALVTDGRLSGASGKVPAAIHVTPEAYCGGLLAKIRSGDRVRVNGHTGELTLLVDESELERRQPEEPDLSRFHLGCGRELFGALRESLSGAEQGAVVFDFSNKKRRVRVITFAVLPWSQLIARHAWRALTDCYSMRNSFISVLMRLFCDFAFSA
ncbi:hypothetical protein [Yersinia entomophaga]|uniref:hypothetical protein n=1 Tax=Yersinia entomophaga TaxID=935293 RepID=UPI003FA115D4